MNVYSVDPLVDARWDAFVARHPNGSVFHSRGWLRSLQRTYDFVPVAFTTSEPTGQLDNALVCCAVRSWITGDRLVSLPFSDHCDPLVDGPDDFNVLCAAIEQCRAGRRWKYAELRPVRNDLHPGPPFHRTDSYFLHQLDLRPDAGELWKHFHRDSIQRRIQRAERERLDYEEGRSDSLIARFSDLLELTRRRHRMPPQPRDWLRNLVDCLQEAVSIRVVSANGQPAAGILSLIHGKTVVYKYGGSDERHHHLGGTPLLFWRMIEDAKRIGAELLDLGRTDTDNDGLIVFKERWGARRLPLTYWRCPETTAGRGGGAASGLAREVFKRLPQGVRRATANLIYRHLA